MPRLHVSIINSSALAGIHLNTSRSFIESQCFMQAAVSNIYMYVRIYVYMYLLLQNLRCCVCNPDSLRKLQRLLRKHLDY